MISSDIQEIIFVAFYSAENMKIYAENLEKNEQHSLTIAKKE